MNYCSSLEKSDACVSHSVFEFRIILSEGGSGKRFLVIKNRSAGAASETFETVFTMVRTLFHRAKAAVLMKSPIPKQI